MGVPEAVRVIVPLELDDAVAVRLGLDPLLWVLEMEGVLGGVDEVETLVLAVAVQVGVWVMEALGLGVPVEGGDRVGDTLTHPADRVADIVAVIVPVIELVAVMEPVTLLVGVMDPVIELVAVIVLLSDCPAAH